MEAEVLVLELVIRAGTITAAEIAKQSGQSAAGVERVLKRLVQLGYASHKGSRYKAEARLRGHGGFPRGE